jgi:hypothetical protein
VLIREYTESDLDALRRMHARQGFDYPFPDLADPIFISKLVVEDDAGRAVMASLARLTCEMYLLMDRDGAADASCPGECLADTSANGESPCGVRRLAAAVSPPELAPAFPNARHSSHSKMLLARQRYAWLLALHCAGERDLFARGLDDAHAWLPPRIARRFGRRLESLGWVRDDAWTPYCRRLSSP